MKVKEIIEQLQKFNPENELYILESGDSPFDSGDSIKRVYEVNTVELSVNGVYIETDY